MAKAKEYTVTVDKDSAKLVTAAQKVALARKAVNLAATRLGTAEDKLELAIEAFNEVVDKIKYNEEDDVFYGANNDDNDEVDF